MQTYWIGASGTRYAFTAYQNGAQLPAGGGIYVFSTTPAATTEPYTEVVPVVWTTRGLHQGVFRLRKHALVVLVFRPGPTAVTVIAPRDAAARPLPARAPPAPGHV